MTQEKNTKGANIEALSQLQEKREQLYAEIDKISDEITEIKLSIKVGDLFYDNYNECYYRVINIDGNHADLLSYSFINGHPWVSVEHSYKRNINYDWVSDDNGILKKIKKYLENY